MAKAPLQIKAKKIIRLQKKICHSFTKCHIRCFSGPTLSVRTPPILG